MYCIKVTPCLSQSAQKLLAENFLANANVCPKEEITPKSLPSPVTDETTRSNNKSLCLILLCYYNELFDDESLCLFLFCYYNELFDVEYLVICFLFIISFRFGAQIYK